MAQPVFGEIQGLRALAVTLVVLFHVWPHLIPGGYVGVDVFFVISGFLITGSLVASAAKTGTISLLEFYNRRVRRLLPAATLVIVASAIGTFLFLPEARWAETVNHLLASAFYVENWLLAWESVDYLAAENAASPVQHYWSLSVEEQFYIIWPLFMLLGATFAKVFRLRSRPVFFFLLALIFVLSLVASVVLTASDPAPSYFATYTRAWEMALGGLLALAPRHLIPAQAKPALFLAGLAAVICAGILYSAGVSFPGYAALLPTIGAALILAAGSVNIFGWKGLDLPLLRWVGDRSYSIYLWHWPLIVFYTAQSTSLGYVDGIGLGAVTLLLAEISYRYVEEPLRRSRKPKEWKPLAYSIMSLALIAISAASFQTWLAMSSARGTNNQYPGPNVLLAGAETPTNVQAIPALTQLKTDLPDVYALGCHQSITGTEVVSCQYGDADSDTTIAIVGDPHAASWVPALEAIVDAKGWNLVTYTKSSCSYGQLTTQEPCLVWQDAVHVELLVTKPTWAFFAKYNNSGPKAVVPTADLLSKEWTELADAGIQVVAIKDTPDMGFEPGDCLADEARECRSVRGETMQEDPLVLAAEQTPAVRLADMTDAICGPEYCEAVVGNMVVWRDPHHLTATYAAALAPYLAMQAGLGTLQDITMQDQTRVATLVSGSKLREDMAEPTVPPPAADSSSQSTPAVPPSPSAVTKVAETVLPQPTVHRPAVKAPTGNPVHVVINCGPTEGFESFERIYKGALNGTEFGVLRGVPDENGYEHWVGTVSDDGALTITGEYIEGYYPMLKSLSLHTTSTDNGKTFEGGGERGPRQCTVSMTIL